MLAHGALTLTAEKNLRFCNKTIGRFKTHRGFCKTVENKKHIEVATLLWHRMGTDSGRKALDLCMVLKKRNEKHT